MIRRWLCAPRGQALTGLPALVFGLLAAALLGCDRQGAESAGDQTGGGASRGEVVVYCSADSVYAEPILAAFTARTGIRARAVYDTEATKTTGLVNRLLTEQDAPRADVWWSSEPFGTVRLANAGVLEPYTSEAAEREMGGAWPPGLRGAEGTWYGFASRARVFVYNTEAVSAERAPRTLADLTDPRFKGRVGLARPEFGTTRGHAAAVAERFGPDALRAWLTALRSNGLRLYDGNASVVRAVARGEIHVGLTDTDDVYAGQREGWPVALAYERLSPEAAASAEALMGGAGMGPMLVPNTVAKVRGGPNGTNAGPLIDFLLSPEAQRMLARSDSRNIPTYPEVRAEFTEFVPPESAPLDLERVAGRVEEAMKICDEVLGGS